MARKRTLKQMTKAVLKLLPPRFTHVWVRDKKVPIENKTIWNTIEDDDVWVDFCPFVLSRTKKGWELADGDPVCNWCGNSFTKIYPVDVDASVIAKKVMQQWKDSLPH